MRIEQTCAGTPTPKPRLTYKDSLGKVFKTEQGEIVLVARHYLASSGYYRHVNLTTNVTSAYAGGAAYIAIGWTELPNARLVLE